MTVHIVHYQTKEIYHTYQLSNMCNFVPRIKDIIWHRERNRIVTQIKIYFEKSTIEVYVK